MSEIKTFGRMSLILESYLFNNAKFREGSMVFKVSRYQYIYILLHLVGNGKPMDRKSGNCVSIVS